MQPCVDWVRNLLEWYEKSKRDLPWRKYNDPYSIWVSEIMLQQTRVETVIGYYHRFLERFPTVGALAQGDPDEVLKLWEGLGYYSRARNLHRAARDIVVRYEGVFPETYQEVLSLPGIGKYTAGAIMSIAFNQAYPAVDGNVLRVISRLFLLEKDIASKGVKEEIETLLRGVFPEGRASDFTQSLMELGALICQPSCPECLRCPVRKGCKAYAANRQNDLPLKQKAVKQRRAQRYIALIQMGGNILMNKRPAQGLLGGLWEFPGVEAKNIAQFIRDFQREYGLTIVAGDHWVNAKHVFTHLIWEMKVYRCESLNENIPENTGLRWIPVREMDSIPIPGAFQTIKEKLISENTKIY